MYTSMEECDKMRIYQEVFEHLRERYNPGVIGEKVMENFQYCKIEIFIPETHLSKLQSALQSVDAGHIGNYDSCLSYSQVMGCWRPLEGSSPYIGEENAVSAEPELKVEVTCLRDHIDVTIDAVKKIHPYEVPVINVIPLYRTSFS